MIDEARIIALGKAVLESEAGAIGISRDLLDATFAEAVRLIHQTAGMVVTSGMGKSGLIAQKISATFASTGSASIFLHPAEAMHGDLGRLRRDDVLILLSYGGATEECLALAALARQDGVKVIAMTRSAQSHLGRISDVALSIGDVNEAHAMNLAPTSSTASMLALGDAMALAAAECRGFSAEDFAKRHPGGALGRLMMPVTDVMRQRVDNNLPLFTQDQSVAQVLRGSGGGRRSGASLIVDTQGQLTGIFTDGDLRRLLIERGSEALQLPMHQVMTQQPRHLEYTARVQDAVQLIREFRLDEIPIVDTEQRPVGLIDVQDMVGLKVIDE